MFHKTVHLGEDSDHSCAHSTEAQHFQKQETLMLTTQFLALVGYVVAGGFSKSQDDFARAYKGCLVDRGAGGAGCRTHDVKGTGPPVALAVADVT